MMSRIDAASRISAKSLYESYHEANIYYMIAFARTSFSDYSCEQIHDGLKGILFLKKP